MTKTTIQEATVSHESLGTLKGRRVRSNVLQFRSIPFATIPGRFRQSVLVTELGDERDFTEYGFACPARKQSNDFNGGPLPGDTPAKYDEFKCLTLTISTPISSMSEGGAKKKLPVLMYCHGGGFVEGAGSISDSKDTSNMVELGLQAGRPVVTVNMHYRLNYFGFLACQVSETKAIHTIDRLILNRDLVTESNSTKQPPSNFGLYDQRNSFLWIKRFISGFGGDPDDITAFGESAGSAVIAFQMCSTIPLFRRAILMAAAPATLPPLSLEKKEEEYHELLRYCDIDVNDPARLELLKNIPAEKIVELAQTKGSMNLVEDLDFWPVTPGSQTQGYLLANCSWVEELIIGDSFLEGYLFSDKLKTVKAADFISIFEHNLGPEKAARILQAYDITPEMDTNLFWSRSTMLMGDLIISEPIHSLTNALSQPSTGKKIYRYTNTIRNPFPGSSSYQVCGHAVDMLYFFGNYLDRFPTQRGRDISLEFVTRFTKFAYGLEPWARHVSREGKIAIADGHLGWITRTRDEDERISKDDEMGGRRYVQWDIISGVIRELDQEGDRIRANLLNLRKE